MQLKCILNKKTSRFPRALIIILIKKNVYCHEKTKHLELDTVRVKVVTCLLKNHLITL